MPDEFAQRLNQEILEDTLHALATLPTRVQELKGEVDTLQQRVSDLNGEVDAVESRLTSRISEEVKDKQDWRRAYVAVAASIIVALLGLAITALLKVLGVL